MNHPRPRRLSRIAPTVVLAAMALAPTGCARGRGQITPTTTGTDLRAMPRGRMIPQPFPGSSLARGPARAARVGPTADPEATTASAEGPPL